MVFNDTIFKQFLDETFSDPVFIINPIKYLSEYSQQMLISLSVIFCLENQYLLYLFDYRLQYETLDSDVQTHRNHENFKDNLLGIFQVGNHVYKCLIFTTDKYVIEQRHFI